MIDKLHIENFQSHEDTVLEFCSGINVIIGSSDKGKTAILRAFYWLLQNKPDGLGIVSHWNITDKGTIKQPTQVTLSFDDNTITRFRHRDINRYLVNQEKFDAIRRDVPHEVSDLLNITDINIQKQLDPHFLLSNGAGEVARILNKTVRLDVIDEVLSLVESTKRQSRSTRDSLEAELVELQKEYDSFSWLIAAREVVDEAVQMESMIFPLHGVLQALRDTGEEYREALEVCDKVDMQEVELLIGKVEVLSTSLGELSRKRGQLDSLKKEFVEAQEVVTSIDISPIEALVDDVQNKISMVQDLDDKRKALDLVLSIYNTSSRIVEEVDKEIHDLYESLPDVCPLCDGTGKLKGE